MEPQKTQNCKNNPREKRKAGGIILSDFRQYYKAPVHRDQWTRTEKGQFSFQSLRNAISNDNPVYETAKETLMYRTVLWTLWERVGRFGRMALKHVKCHV